MKLVVIESPFAGDTELNLAYLACCMRDSLRRDEAPIASHSLYTREGCLDDTLEAERALGIKAGFAWADKAELRAVYTNLGVSKGMEEGILHASKIGQPIQMRALDEEQWPAVPKRPLVLGATEMERIHNELTLHGAPPGHSAEARIRALGKQQTVALENARTFRKLPRERRSVTRKIPIGAHDDLYITISLYEDGSPGGVQLKMAKQGDMESGFMDALASAVSLGLKHGVPLAKFVSKLTNLKFEPSGFTGQKDIPHVESPVDAFAKYMKLRFLPPAIEVIEEKK